MVNQLFMSSVEESVSNSMKDGKILVVYNSKGDDDWLNSWFQSGYEEQLRKRAVWLKLVRGTEQFQYFEQIFPSVEVPSFYLISNGQILSTIQGADDGSHWEDLTEKLNIDTSLRDSSRASGRTLKEQVADTARQRYAEQLAKEKKSAKEERERILRLVKADRVERRALHDSSAPPPALQSEEIHDNIKNTQRLHTKTCTLLIKLTNGENITKEFDSRRTLNDVRKWVDKNRTDGDGPYAFHRNIPRVTFADSDELRTLEALELLPRSVLIIKPLENAYRSLNVAEAKGPGLLGKVYHGISTWWAGNNGSRETSAPTAREGDSKDQRSHLQERGSINAELLAGAVSAPALADEVINGSPHSSRIDSPVYSAHEYHLRHDPSELSLPSRCVTPNVYHFVNAEDEDKDHSTYNGNTLNLEKKKDDD